MTLLFRQKRMSCFYHWGVHLHLEKKSEESLPQKHTAFSSWRKTPEQWKLPLSPGWLIQSFSDPCLQEMWLSQEAKPWGFEVPNHVRSIGLSDIVMMFFLRECPFCLSFSSMSLWQISPRHRRCFPYGGRLMCLLWFCLGLCWPCSSLRVLESAAHHSSPSLQYELCSLFRHAKKKKHRSFCVFPSIHLPKPPRTPTAGPQKELHLQPALKLQRCRVCAEALQHPSFGSLTFSKAKERVRYMVRSNPSFLVLFCQLLNGWWVACYVFVGLSTCKPATTCTTCKCC